MRDLVGQLRVDFGRKTLGELAQEREAAANEIERLQNEVALFRSSSARIVQSSHKMAISAGYGEKPVGSTLLRLGRVCEIVGLARSTVYYLIANGRFPRPIQVSTRAIRWNSADISAWVDARIRDGSC